MTDQRRDQAETPPILVRRGLKGMALLFAILAPAMIFAVELHSQLGSALAIPKLGDYERHYTSALHILVLMVLFPARPVRGGHWLLMAAAAMFFQTAAALGWWGMIILLRYLAPEFAPGLFTGMLPWAAGGASGWLAFHVIHRLSGAYSPWHGAGEAMTGTPPA